MENLNENEQKNNTASAEVAGSANDLIAGPAKSDVKPGQPAENASQKNEVKETVEETVPKKQYEDLESRLGTQGEELGKYREFITQVSPLLEKLDKQPELVQAIVDGKISPDLVKAVLEDKVSIKDAETVTQAHEEVKKEVGTETYNAMKPEEITKLINEKVAEGLSGVKKNIDEVEEIRNFEKKFDNFVNSTPDFAEYASEIDKWFDENPDQDNIQIAYNAVKGIVLERKMKEGETKDAGEAAKIVAANVGGGSSQNASIVNNKKVIDELIGDSKSANIF
jgi:hypothetical protein